MDSSGESAPFDKDASVKTSPTMMPLSVDKFQRSNVSTEKPKSVMSMENLPKPSLTLEDDISLPVPFKVDTVVYPAKQDKCAEQVFPVPEPGKYLLLN